MMARNGRRIRPRRWRARRDVADGERMPGRLGRPDDDLGKRLRPQSSDTSRLIRYVRPHLQAGLALIIAIVGIVVYTLAIVAVPLMVREGIDAIIDGNSDRVTGVAVAVVAAALIGWGAQYIHLIVMARVSQGILYALRTQMFQHLHRLSLSFYDRNEVGRIMSRVQSDVLNLQEFLGSGVMGLAELLSLVFIMIALFLLDAKLAAITLAVAPALLIGLIIWQGRGPLRLYSRPSGHRPSELRPAGEHLRRAGYPEP